MTSWTSDPVTSNSSDANPLGKPIGCGTGPSGDAWVVRASVPECHPTRFLNAKTIRTADFRAGSHE
jgi:hypothetical protein